MSELIEAFYEAALFLIEQIKNRDWVWRSNYLREHVRCASGLKFSNSLSALVLHEVMGRHPELRSWITIKPLKDTRGEDQTAGDNYKR